LRLKDPCDLKTILKTRRQELKSALRSPCVSVTSFASGAQRSACCRPRAQMPPYADEVCTHLAHVIPETNGRNLARESFDPLSEQRWD
jgi:hypothetical protein